MMRSFKSNEISNSARLRSFRSDHHHLLIIISNQILSSQFYLVFSYFFRFQSWANDAIKLDFLFWYTIYSIFDIDFIDLKIYFNRLLYLILYTLCLLPSAACSSGFLVRRWTHFVFFLFFWFFVVFFWNSEPNR